MNEYLEECLEINDMTKYKRNSLIFSIISITSYVFIFIGFTLAPVTPDFDITNCNSSSFLPNVILLLLYFGTFLFLGIFFGRKKNRSIVEYDYVLSSDKLSVSKIFNRQSRKLADRIFLKTIYKLGKLNSDAYKKLTLTPNIKVFDFTVNKIPNEDKQFFYLYVKTNEGAFIYHLECTEKLIAQIVKFVGREVIEENYKR